MGTTPARPHSPAAPRPRRWCARRASAALLAAALLAAALPAQPPRADAPFTLRDLEAARLTPKQFANLFEHFDFLFRAAVQPPDQFLAARRGDCDDFAALADLVLGRQGRTTRLVQVQLVGSNIDHAVCYVVEDRVYLDFLNRRYTFNLTRSRPFLRDIAGKVADSLERNWTTAHEFTYSYADRRKRTVRVVVKTDDPARDPDRSAPPPP
jgi:hypothetical protein